jgi:hypothetical protein
MPTTYVDPDGYTHTIHSPGEDYPVPPKCVTEDPEWVIRLLAPSGESCWTCCYRTLEERAQAHESLITRHGWPEDRVVDDPEPVRTVARIYPATAS